MNYLVSVIVPIYNMQDYLDECVSSITKQTYKNLEIILVDDGSIDNSPQICDLWKKKDTRISVIHKENGGLSSARNAGIECAKGEYLSFIDSDDYIDSQMIENLMNAIIANNTQIAFCDYYSKEKKKKTKSDKILNKREAIGHLLDKKGYKCFAWNKLYHKELFNDVRYQENKIFEDIIPTYLILKKVDRVAYVRKPYYFYRIRKDSITRSPFTEKNKDLLYAIDYVYNDAKKNNICNQRTLLSGYIIYFSTYVNNGIRAGADVQKEKEYFKDIIKQNLLVLMTSRNFPVAKKIQILILLFNDKFYSYLLCRGAK